MDLFVYESVLAKAAELLNMTSFRFLNGVQSDISTRKVEKLYRRFCLLESFLEVLRSHKYEWFTEIFPPKWGDAASGSFDYTHSQQACNQPKR
jgi:hypothetical protein